MINDQRNGTRTILVLAALAAAGYWAAGYWVGSSNEQAIDDLEAPMAREAAEARPTPSTAEKSTARKQMGPEGTPTILTPGALSSHDDPLPPGQEPTPASGPLERLLGDRRAEPLEARISLLLDPDGDVAQRVAAAHYVLTEALAIHLELAGTATSPRKEGDETPLPAKLQFFKEGRLYCFEDSEFPVWKECKGYLFSGTPDHLSDTFVQEVAALGQDALASIRG